MQVLGLRAVFIQAVPFCLDSLAEGIDWHPQLSVCYFSSMCLQFVVDHLLCINQSCKSGYYKLCVLFASKLNFQMPMFHVDFSVGNLCK